MGFEQIGRDGGPSLRTCSEYDQSIHYPTSRKQNGRSDRVTYVNISPRGLPDYYTMLPVEARAGGSKTKKYVFRKVSGMKRFKER